MCTLTFNIRHTYYEHYQMHIFPIRRITAYAFSTRDNQAISKTCLRARETRRVQYVPVCLFVCLSVAVCLTASPVRSVSERVR